MYASVVARFLTWKPTLTPTSQIYCDAVRADPLVSRWYDLAREEPESWLIDTYETPA